ncbi:MAG TPA: hypothetical protein VM187_05180 [Niastella sp.]|nr:hypothetical protein [Niastella sp.]
MKRTLLFVTASMYLSCSLLAQEGQQIDSLLLKSTANAEFTGSVLVAKQER